MFCDQRFLGACIPTTWVVVLVGGLGIPAYGQVAASPNGREVPAASLAAEGNAVIAAAVPAATMTAEERAARRAALKAAAAEKAVAARSNGTSKSATSAGAEHAAVGQPAAAAAVPAKALPGGAILYPGNPAVSAGAMGVVGAPGDDGSGAFPRGGAGVESDAAGSSGLGRTAQADR